MADLVTQADADRLARESYAALGAWRETRSWHVSSPSFADLKEAWGMVLEGVPEGICAACFGVSGMVFRRRLVRGNTDLARRYAEAMRDAAKAHALAHTAMMIGVAAEAQHEAEGAAEAAAGLVVPAAG